MPEPRTVTYRGTDSRGAGRVGRESLSDVAAWVEARYRQGWRYLTVRDSEDREIGAIWHLDGRRMWYAETGNA